MRRSRIALLSLLTSAGISIGVNYYYMKNDILMFDLDDAKHGFEIPSDYQKTAVYTASCPNSTLFPILPKIPKLSIGLVTSEYPFTVTTKHVLVDGIENSNFLELKKLCLMKVEYGCSLDPDIDLYIVDLVRLRPFNDHFVYHNLTQQLLHAGNPTWKVLLIDYSDQNNFKESKFYKRLELVNDQVGGTIGSSHEHVRLAISSIVQGRHYDHEMNRIIPGHLFPIDRWEVGGGPVLHCPYAVRSDVVETMIDYLSSSDVGARNESCPVKGIAHKERWMDAIHLWEPGMGAKQTRHAARYRDDVSNRISDMNGTIVGSGDTLRTSIRLRGRLGIKGRSIVDVNYIDALLTSKMVVVTQRDKWEDHYRLMEALSTGGLVLSDNMLSLPGGLINGTNIILFHNVDHMEELILYFLAHEAERLRIAEAGFEIAMRRHRSWHRLEELIFGCSISHTDSECIA